MMQNKKLPTVEWSKKLDIQGGTQPPRSQFIDTPEEGYIRLIQIRDFESEKYVTYVPKTSKLKTCNKEDLFIARYGASIGRILRGLEGAYNVALAKVILKDDTFNKDFLYYFLQSNLFQNHIHRISSRSAQSGFNKNDLASIPVPNPFIKEQQKIAAILSSVDEAIEKTEEIIEQTEKVKKGLMQELLTKGIGHTEFKDSPLGKIPSVWKTIDFANVVDVNEKYSFTGGPFGSDLTSKEYTDEGVRIIQLQNIGDGEFLNDYQIFTSVEKADALYKCNIFPGDIIIAKMAEPVARACLIPDYDTRYVMASDGIRVKVDETKYNKKYILHAINSQYFRKQAEINSTGTTRLRIGLTALRKLKMAIPPYDEQVRISNIIDNLVNKIYAEKKYLQKLKINKQGLMQQLLTGKKRVKVDDNEEVLS